MPGLKEEHRAVALKQEEPDEAGRDEAFPFLRRRGACQTADDDKQDQGVEPGLHTARAGRKAAIPDIGDTWPGNLRGIDARARHRRNKDERPLGRKPISK